MTNELLLVGTLVAYFGFMLLAYKLFGRAGLYGFTIFATRGGKYRRCCCWSMPLAWTKP